MNSVISRLISTLHSKQFGVIKSRDHNKERAYIISSVCTSLCLAKKVLGVFVGEDNNNVV